MKKSREAFRTISEVAEWLDTPPHVLRFWESRFPEVAPIKRAGGRRYYRPADMQLLGGIKHLLHVEGHTIKSVQDRLRVDGTRGVSIYSPSLDVEEVPADPLNGHAVGVQATTDATPHGARATPGPGVAGPADQLVPNATEIDPSDPAIGAPPPGGEAASAVFADRSSGPVAAELPLDASEIATGDADRPGLGAHEPTAAVAQAMDAAPEAGPPMPGDAHPTVGDAEREASIAGAAAPPGSDLHDLVPHRDDQAAAASETDNTISPAAEGFEIGDGVRPDGLGGAAVGAEMIEDPDPSASGESFDASPVGELEPSRAAATADFPTFDAREDLSAEDPQRGDADAVAGEVEGFRPLETGASDLAPGQTGSTQNVAYLDSGSPDTPSPASTSAPTSGADLATSEPTSAADEPELPAGTAGPIAEPDASRLTVNELSAAMPVDLAPHLASDPEEEARERADAEAADPVVAAAGGEPPDAVGVPSPADGEGDVDDHLTLESHGGAIEADPGAPLAAEAAVEAAPSGAETGSEQFHDPLSAELAGSHPVADLGNDVPPADETAGPRAPDSMAPEPEDTAGSIAAEHPLRSPASGELPHPSDEALPLFRRSVAADTGPAPEVRELAQQASDPAGVKAMPAEEADNPPPHRAPSEEPPPVAQTDRGAMPIGFFFDDGEDAVPAERQTGRLADPAQAAALPAVEDPADDARLSGWCMPMAARLRAIDPHLVSAAQRTALTDLRDRLVQLVNG